MAQRNRQSGITLVETVLGVALFVFLVGSLLILTQMTTKTMVKSKQKIVAEKLMQMGITTFKNMPFWHLVTMDSAAAQWGMSGSFNYPAGFPSSPTGIYPSSAAVALFISSMTASKYDRFTLTVKFWRRDSADNDGDGLFSDLIEYKDANNDGADDFDPTRVKYQDKNLDGDFNDVYLSNDGWPYTDQPQSECPSTDLREITLTLYKKQGGSYVAVSSRAAMINLGQNTGQMRISNESYLHLLISTPAYGSAVRQYHTSQQQDHYNLAISSLYPPGVIGIRADHPGQPLVLEGETDPFAIIRICSINSPSVLDSITADGNGFFSGAAPNITSSLWSNANREGMNYFVAYASYTFLRSPNAIHAFIWDERPPKIMNMTPTGNITDRSPFVAAWIVDETVSTTSVSGVCPYVMKLEINGSSGTYVYNQGNGRLHWIDATTRLPIQLNNGTYNVHLEGGDFAQYKTTHTWTFTLGNPGTPDTALPTVGFCENENEFVIKRKVVDVGSGASGAEPTGINPSTIVMEINGTPVVTAANISEVYDPETGYITYKSLISYNNVPLTVRVTVSDWSGNAADDSCSMTISY